MRPLARYASLNRLVDLCHRMDVDAVTLVRQAGLEPNSLRLQDRWVPAEAIADLLERAAAASGRADFGLQLAGMRSLANLGPLSLVIREEPDVRSALGVLIRYQHMYNEAVYTRLTEDGGIASVRVHIDTGESVDPRQAVELAVGVVFGVLAGFLGPGWRPLSVSFTHPAPPEPRIHFQTFRTVVKFGEDFNGISLYSSDLDAKNADSDPLLRPYAQQVLDDTAASHDATTPGRVRDLIEMLLPTGRCSAEQVARSLGVDRRTVYRWLAEDGHTFSSIVDDTRAELAAQLVKNRRNSLTDISAMLGFSAASNFSRWFKTRFGCSPRQWRLQAEGEFSEEAIATDVAGHQT